MILLLLVMGLLIVGCAVPPTTAPPPPPTPAFTAAPVTLVPTAVPPAPAATVTNSPTVTILPALWDATLPRLAERTFEGGAIETTEVLTETHEFITSLISYSSDGVKITGLLNVPRQEGKHPAVVLLHGYVPPPQYTLGLDAQGMAVELAKQGYITLVPDLRGYAESGHAPNFFISGWIADAINAANSLREDDRVDADHIGLWGHSMGGGTANRAMVVSDVFDAVVLYAPISADIDDMFMDPFGGEESGLTEELVKSVVAALQDEEFRAQISPLNYLEETTAPVSIHVGTADSVTPPQWSRAIRDGLQAAGKRVEYFEYPGGGHTLRGAQQQEFHTRVIDFFDHYLK